MPVSQMMMMMMICSSSFSVVSLSSDKPTDAKHRDKEAILKIHPQFTPRPRQERRQETTTVAPTVNCMYLYGGKLEDHQDH